MARQVRGVLAIENEETGDSRVLAPGSVTWVDPPMPIAWLIDGDQHVDLIEVAPTVGTIQSITRSGNDITFTGQLDDQQDDGAEMVRRMEAGTATHGTRFGLSIDPDDWAVEIIATDPEAADEMLMAAAGGQQFASFTTRGVSAAAGDPDPGDNGGDGVILFDDDSGSIIQRFTRLRIRGVTACAVPAFDGAYMELDGDATAEATPAAPAQDGVTAGAPALVRGLFPPNPPAGWFGPVTDEPDGSINIVASGSDAGRGWGYIAAWNTCHSGYLDRCVTPPREVDYEPYHTGRVQTDDGQMIACGVLTWGIAHAGLSASMIEAQDHYSHSDAMFARVAVGANEHGIWWAGAMRAGATGDDVADLQALALSGDWRWSEQARSLRLIAATAVTYPGFAVPQRSSMAAAARIAPLRQLAPDVYVEGDRIMAMTSAGVLLPHTADETVAGCSCHDRPTEELRLLRALDRRTRHLIPDAVAASAAKVQSHRV